MINREPVDEHLDSQEEVAVCHHCKSEQIEYRSRLVACETTREPAEYEGWYFCWECGEGSEYDDV